MVNIAMSNSLPPPRRMARFLDLEHNAVLPGDHGQQIKGIGVAFAQLIEALHGAAPIALARAPSVKSQISASLASLTSSLTSSTVMWQATLPT